MREPDSQALASGAQLGQAQKRDQMPPPCELTTCENDCEDQVPRRKGSWWNDLAVLTWNVTVVVMTVKYLMEKIMYRYL